MARLKASDLPDGASEIFFDEGLDEISENQPSGKSPAENCRSSGDADRQGIEIDANRAFEAGRAPNELDQHMRD